MSLESSRSLSGVGSLLLFVSASLMVVSLLGGLFVGLFGALVLGGVGVILLLIGLYGLSNYYGNRGIFRNGLIATVILAVGLVIAFLILSSVVLSNFTPLMRLVYPDWNGTMTDLPNMTPNPSVAAPSNIDIASVMPFLTGFAVFWVVAWLTVVASVFLIRRSLVAIAEKSTLKLFGTAGLLMLIGGFLGLVAVGYFLVIVGVLLMGVAFFQLRPVEPLANAAVAVPAQPAPA